MKKKEVLKKAAAVGMTICVTLSYSGIAMAAPGPQPGPDSHPPVAGAPAHPEPPEGKGPHAEKPDPKAEAPEVKPEDPKAEIPETKQVQESETPETKVNGEQGNHDETKIPYIVTSGDVTNMTVGDTVKIVASVENNPNTGNGGVNQLKWTVTSSDETVLKATMDKGTVTVTAVGEGTATISIRAYANGNGSDKGNVGTGHVAFDITGPSKTIEVKPVTTVLPDTSAPVYVYGQAKGNYSEAGLKALGINKINMNKGWFTIGQVADVSGLADPKSDKPTTSLTRDQKKEINDEILKFDANKNFDISNVTFGDELQVEPQGATDYVGGGATYHYNGTVEFYKVEYKSGYDDDATLKSVDTLVKGMDTPTCDTPSREGYVFAGWDKDNTKAVSGNAVYTAKWVPADQAIYVYVKVLGNPGNKVLEEMGLTQVNKNGYCTLGTAVYNGAVPAKEKTVNDIVNLTDEETNAILTKLTKTHNTGFDALDLVTWSGLKVSDGADTMANEAPFVANGTNTYHLDGTIEFTKYDVVYYWMNGNDKVILNTSDETTGIVGQEVKVTPTEKIEVKNEDGQKVIRLFAADSIPEGTYKPVSAEAITKKLASGKNTIEIECIKEAEAPAEPGTTTPDNGGNDTPTVTPEGSEPAAPAEPAEDEITGDAPGSEALGTGSDVIDSDAMGNPDPIDADDAEEDISAAPKGVKTGDETAPWAMGFGAALAALGGAVALRRREEE